MKRPRRHTTESSGEPDEDFGRSSQRFWGVIDRWILRLGKNEEEAGKFEPWALAASTQAEDFAGFLACLNLTNLVDSVTQRMAVQKKGVREAKKKIKAEQKEIAKMQAKVAAAEAKAQKKIERAAERERIKIEAKKNREEAKRASKIMGRKQEGQVEDRIDIPSVRQTAEDTPKTAMDQKVEAVVVVQPDVLPEPHVPKASDVVFEEVPVVHRRFAIPEEG